VMLREPEEGVRTTDEQITAAEETATTAGADAEMATEPGGETGESAADAEMSTESAGGTGETGVTKTEVTDDEIGKQVVSGNDEVGLVTDVEGDTLYVDPDPSLTDKIKAALDWGDSDEESYPVEADQVERIDNEEVRIREI